VVPCNPKIFKNNFILIWNHGPDSSLRYRRYINHLLTYLLKLKAEVTG